MARGGLGFPIHMSLKILNGTDALDVCLSHAWERPPKAGEGDERSELPLTLNVKVKCVRCAHPSPQPSPVGGRGSKTKSFHTHFLLN